MEHRITSSGLKPTQVFILGHLDHTRESSLSRQHGSGRYTPVPYTWHGALPNNLRTGKNGSLDTAYY